MKKSKSCFMRAVNDVLECDEAEEYFIRRLSHKTYIGVKNLRYYMSKTMKARIIDIADAVTTIVVYRLYGVNGRENEQHAIQFLYQFKCLRVLVNNLCECLSIHDLDDEILNKVETIGKPLFNFINKNY